MTKRTSLHMTLGLAAFFTATTLIGAATGTGLGSVTGYLKSINLDYETRIQTIDSYTKRGAGLGGIAGAMTLPLIAAGLMYQEYRESPWRYKRKLKRIFRGK